MTRSAVSWALAGCALIGLSFVIAAYNMDAQLKRTLQSLADDYQKVDYSEIEVIIIDNGSTVPIRVEAMRRFTNVTEVIRVEGQPSPVFGLNRGIEAASFSNVALMIETVRAFKR